METLQDVLQETNISIPVDSNIKDSIFSFRENGVMVKTKNISYQILSNSKEFIPSSGKPQASRPEASWVTLQKIRTLLDLRNIANDIDAIYVDKEESNHPLTSEERLIYGDDIPVKMWIFNRLIARITLVTPEESSMPGMTAAIAFAYNKNGIQIAFGTNVNICSNFSILSGRVFQTYGENKVSYDDIMTSVAQYIDNLPQWQAAEYEMIQAMQNTAVGTLSDVNEIIGILLRAAVTANMKNDLSALNITEVSELVRELISTKPEEFRNVWHLFNVGTFVLNFSGKVNFIDAIDKHVMWRDVVLQKYDIPLLSIL